MKNILENVAVATVVVLFLVIITLIVRYNMIDDEYIVDEIMLELPAVKEESKKAKTTNYLQNLESYTDVDVKVDPTKENSANKVKVSSELVQDAIGLAVENTDKSTYVDSLNKYADKKGTDTSAKAKTEKELQEEKTEDDKVKLDQEEIDDDIGQAIGEALEDI